MASDNDLQTDDLVSNTWSPRYLWWYLAAVAVLAGVLVWAEQRTSKDQPQPLWYVAQACATVIVLLTLAIAWSRIRKTAEKSAKTLEAKAYNRAIGRLSTCVLMGYFALVVLALRHDHWVCGVAAKAFGYDTIIAGASLFSGALLGLLFGFRPVANPQPSKTSNADKDDSLAPRHPHTNLEEIADWFTKVIIGAGLVGLTKIVGALPSFGAFMARGVEPDPSPSTCLVDPVLAKGLQASEVSMLAEKALVQLPQTLAPIALAIVIFFLTCGVMYGYLWSRWEVALSAYASDDGTESVAKDKVPEQKG
jgi:hypothetical protein